MGFTLAEVLIVIAIIGILGGVVAINVAQHFRSLTKLEYDSYAKSIFVAAQNHLTMAEHEGYLGRTDFGNKEDAISGISDTGNGVYYFVVQNGNIGDESVLSLILPDNAVDASVLSQSFIIRYHKPTAQVLDVFYWSEGGAGGDLFNRASRFKHHYSDEYADFLSKRGDKDALTNYGTDHSVIGYYGGVEAQSKSPVKIKDPSIVVHNEEVLYVRVTDPNGDIETSLLELVIKGNTSGEIKHIFINTNIDNSDKNRIIPRTDLSSDPGKERVFDIILDDITTSGLHFSDLKSGFYPGEDITIYATSSNSEPSNVGYSAEAITNSLFEDSTTVKPNGAKSAAVDAGITNFRHLENMSPAVSGIANSTTSAAKPVYLESAKQQANLDWNGFRGNVNTLWGAWKELRDHVNVYTNTREKMKDNQYLPVDPIVKLSYDGQSHSVKNVSVDHTGPAGLFGSLSEGSSVSNVELIDFTIKGTTNAGALAGTVTNCTVTNVLAHNSKSDTTINITAGGSVGGLIGSADGTRTTVTESAAALTVISTGSDAGGLIGKLSGGSVTASYAGGHTNKATYYTDSGNPIYNVTGMTSGGLIGNITGGTVSNSYSTCSASGTTAGGFVGSAGGTITHCYCTGLVSGTGNNAFIGSGSPTISSEPGKESYYYGIINEVKTEDAAGNTVIRYKEPGNAAVRELDESAATYEAFCGNNWNTANPYDTTLNRYYNGKYNLQTVNQLDTSLGAAGFAVNEHYGDWPAPEAFVVNKGNSSGNSLNPTP